VRLAYYYALCFLVLLNSCSEKKETTQAVISDITVSLYASASVKSKDQYTVLSTVPGILKQIHIEPGDLVKAGDLLFTLENQEATLNADNARQVLNFSTSNSRKNSDRLQEAISRVQAAKEKYELDSAFYYRQKNLWEQNIGTHLDFDQRNLAFTTSKINYDAAQSGLAQLRNQLRNDVELSNINFQLAKKRQANYSIRSEIDGKVFDVITNKGELVGPQTALCIRGKPDQFYLEMNVDENDITSVKMDQEVVITMDSYKGKLFRGRVSKIYPIMDDRSRTFRIEATFSDTPATLYPNLTAEANIIVEVRKKAVLIPRSFLDKDNQVWFEDGTKRKVVTGVQDERNIEILQGLTIQETIYKPD
jgi:multidrug efflux pump subunit AcrA (membrane-fusion protein)